MNRQIMINPDENGKKIAMKAIYQLASKTRVFITQTGGLLIEMERVK